MNACRSCCASCLPVPAVPSEATPYTSLCNFLAAGTLSLKLVSTSIPCSHSHAVDGWHYYPRHALVRSLASPEHGPLLHSLDFLIEHHFLAVTCSVGQLESTPMLYLRVYLIPYDLANVKGKLRNREEAVLTPARRYMRGILETLVVDDRNWDAEPTTGAKQLFLNQDADNRTMAEIYSDLPSPDTSLDDFVADIPGMRSILYPYQQQSVATMLARESQPPLVPHPLYIPISGIDGAEFFLQPATMEVLRERPLVEQPRGGILCEELGTGKTVMMLALILATLDELPSPEESLVDERAVLTPLSFRHFPNLECSLARKRFSAGSKTIKMETSRELPSLVETMVQYIRTEPAMLNLRASQEELEGRSLWAAIAHNTPFYFHFDAPPCENVRLSRRKPDVGPRMMYLSSATLVVVPGNLLAQWENETMIHCHDSLRKLVLRHQGTIPCAFELASNYDVILMTQARFSAESKRNNVRNLHSWTVCRCKEHSGPRVPKCRCKNSPDVTPLLQIRWKRLIIDEGHVASSLSTNMTPFAKLLSVERRWIVTGTPTTNLLGLHFGQGLELQYLEDYEADSGANIDLDAPARTWTSDDRIDLRKLANMTIHFLGVPMFASAVDTRLFDTHVIQPLMERSGPRPGAIRILTQLMNMIMIRHRIDDVERDVLLPTLHQETVSLDLDPYAVKSYNVMQAAVAINAVDSERRDQDYLFHPLNAKDLNVLMLNMSEVLFWHVDNEKLFNVDEIVERTVKFKQTLLERNTSSADVSLMMEALEHVRLAATDPVWRSLQSHQDVFHRVSELPSSIYEVCTTLSQKTFSTVNLVKSERLANLRKFIYQQPLARIERIVEWGEHMNEEEERRMAFIQGARRVAKHSRYESANQRLMALKPGESQEKKEEMRQEWEAVKAKLKALAEDDEQSEAFRPQSNKDATVHSPSRPLRMRSKFLASSPLANMRIGNSTSSKLDYILNEVGQFASTEKFLIFSKSHATLNLVREALELIEVKYLVYAGFTPQERVTPKEREQRITTFETSDTYRVFLMELKHGARGLNLVAASRVIFCEPVWQADVETQAVKRVHRIGQTRPVTVKTLAIRDTYEEVMVTRRQALKARNSKQPDMIDDRRLRDFLANPTFLSTPTAASQRLDLPFLNITAPRLGDPDLTLPSAPKRVHDSSVEDDSLRLKKKSVVLFVNEVDPKLQEIARKKTEKAASAVTRVRVGEQFRPRIGRDDSIQESSDSSVHSGGYGSYLQS